MKRMIAALLALLILLPIPSAHAADGAAQRGQAAQTECTKQCAVELTDAVGDASFLTDASVLTHVRVRPDGAVRIRFDAKIGFVYLSFYELPEQIVLTQIGATGAALSEETFAPDKLNFCLPLSPGCTELCMKGDRGFFLSEVRLFSANTPDGECALPDDVQNWETGGRDAALLVAVARPEDAVGALGALIADYAAERGVAVQVVSMTRPASRRAQEEFLRALWALGVSRYPVCGTFPAAKDASWSEAAASWGYVETRAFWTEMIRWYRPLVAVSNDGKTGADAFLFQQFKTAVLRAGDEAHFHASAHLGAWQVQKLYCASAAGDTKLSADAPLAAFSGGSAADAAGYAYALLKTARILDDTAAQETRFALIVSLVGRDEACSDLLEHVNAAEKGPRTPMLLPEAAPAPTPTPTIAPGEHIPIDALMGDGFRRPFDPPEYVCVDQEHSHFEYRSDTLSVFIDEYAYEDGPDGMTYFIAEIRMREVDAFLPALADGAGDAGTLLRARTLAHKMQAVLFLSGDGLAKEGANAPLLRAGSVYRDGTEDDCLAFLPDGTMRVFLPGEATAEELLAMGVQDTFSAGPWLLSDGAANLDADMHSASLDRTRLAIGMVEKGHFIVFASDGGGTDAVRSIPLSEVASALLDYGCTEAYNLLGGSGVNVIFLGESLNGTDIRYEGRNSNTSGDRFVVDGLVFGRTRLVPAGMGVADAHLSGTE